jgi:hypothetical protein
MQDGHHSLYHYQSVDGDIRLGYLQATLADRTIHLSRPSDFNEPWDCRPWFDATELDDPVEREKLLEWMLRTEALDQAAIEGMRRDPKQLLAFAAVNHRFQLWTINDTHRVYCLTPDPLNPLMWSHYADGHKGIVLEFNATAPQMLYAFRVHYRKEYPPIRMYEEGLGTDLVPFYTKSEVWEYESEYRLIGEEGVSLLNANSPHGVPMVYESTLRLEAGVLTGVVLGCQCDAKRALALLDLQGLDLSVRQAKLMTSKYELTLETIR